MLGRIEAWLIAGYGWLALGMPALVVLVVSQLVGRDGDLGDVSWIEDVCRLLLLWTGLLFVPLLQLMDEHIATQFVRPNSETGRRRLAYLRQAAFLVLGAAFVYAGSVNVSREAGMVGAGGLELPLEYVNSVVPVTGLLVCIVAVLKLVRIARQPR